jgi:hypothetical protein
MASTYSTLKVELIGTGDQTGTWGTTTNDNFSVALGEAITGSADVAFSSADVTVTLTDTNAAQTARNLRLNLTGTSGGARNLILGSGCQIEKLYLINNGLADAVTVKNTSGTGIAVAAGKSMFVYNNGTNVVEAITQFNGTIALASGVSGILPIANGGTGTSSTTFVNLTSNVTGTLPIANGGTGSTSPTFVDLANNVTGTLAVGKGGTGQTSYTDGQLLIGNTSTGLLAKSTLTQGTGISITNAGGAITIAASGGGGGGIQGFEVYNSPGTFTSPANTTNVYVLAVGGGGGGGGARNVPTPEGNTQQEGGYGGSSILGIGVYPVSASTPYAITIGTGGNIGTNSPTSGNPGNAGGSTSFGNLLTVNGGNGGGGSPPGSPGAPGTPGNNGTAPLAEVTANLAVAGTPSPTQAPASTLLLQNVGPQGVGGTQQAAGSAGKLLVYF